MNLLILGSGGREHALAWRLARCPSVSKIFVAPGNGGTSQIAENLPIPLSDHPALIAFAHRENIALTVVGPDDALAAGVSDAFETAGLPIFGPLRAAARLEWSKSHAKDFMRRHHIPTARAETFTSFSEALAAISLLPCPLVIKADGLALGKGVVIAQTPAEAEAALRHFMLDLTLGPAGATVLIEEFLTGPECSIHALLDTRSNTAALLPAAQDHKAVHDGNTGPNTGGMGAFAPTPRLHPALAEQVRQQIIEPTLAGLRADNIDFRGLLFPGLILTPGGPIGLEYNCRFGDPETQAIMPLLQGDLAQWLLATAQGRLAQVAHEIRWSENSSVCVIAASPGYPGPYPKDLPITGLENSAETATRADPDAPTIVFHAGTRRTPEGDLLTNGGRVLGVTATRPTLAAARAAAYATLANIHFDGLHHRHDIAQPSETPAS